MPVTNGIEVRGGGTRDFAVGDTISLDVQTTSGTPNRVRYQVMQMELLPNPNDFGSILRGYAAPVGNDNLDRVQFVFPVERRSVLADGGYAKNLAEQICREVQTHLLSNYGYHAEIVPHGERA